MAKYEYNLCQVCNVSKKKNNLSDTNIKGTQETAQRKTESCKDAVLSKPRCHFDPQGFSPCTRPTLRKSEKAEMGQCISEHRTCPFAEAVLLYFLLTNVRLGL